MQQQLLVYGFGPYGKYSHNITVDIIEQIEKIKLAPTVIFETRFSRKMFETVLHKHQPTYIIGLGQDSRARKIRIERKAINWRKSPGGKGRPISKNGAEFHYVPLKLATEQGTTIAYNAGDYVCNYSMYLMCEYCRKTDSKFAFLHLPLSVNINQCVAFISRAIKNATKV